MKLSVTEFSIVPGCRQQSYIILKSVSTRDNFFEIFGSEIIPTKSWRWNYSHQKVYDVFLYWQQSGIFVSQNRLAHRGCPSGCCEKYHVQSLQSWSSVLVKKDSITRVALIRNLKNGVLLMRFDKGVLFLWQLQEHFLRLSHFLSQICRLSQNCISFTNKDQLKTSPGFGVNLLRKSPCKIKRGRNFLLK